ncbi:hypothetical protein SMICM17S_06903 [Streptomyces microflavus]
MTYAGSCGLSGRVRSDWLSGPSGKPAASSTVISGSSCAGSRSAVAASVISAAGRASSSMYASRSAG